LEGETNGSSATETVTNPKDEKGASQTSNLVDGSDESLVDRVLMCFGEEGVELRRGDDTTHDTLIVSEEQETSGRDCGNGETERAASHAQELDGRTAGGDYVCRHDGVLMRLSELCSEYRIDLQIHVLSKGVNASREAVGDEKKYVGKGGERKREEVVRFLYNVKGQPMGAGWLPRTNQQVAVATLEPRIYPRPRRTSKQEPPRHDDRSLRTPHHPSPSIPSISCGLPISA
jgi:hypothetical protein